MDGMEGGEHGGQGRQHGGGHGGHLACYGQASEPWMGGMEGGQTGVALDALTKMNGPAASSSKM